MLSNIGNYVQGAATVLKTWINYKIILAALAGGAGGMIVLKLSAPRTADIHKLELKMQSLIAQDNANKQQHKFLREYSKYLRLQLNKAKSMRIV